MRKISKAITVLIVLSISVVYLAKTGSAQFLNMTERRYINYGWQDYYPYRDRVQLFERYDFFGNFLMRGEELYTLEEYRSLAPHPGSTIIKGRWWDPWLRRLVIASDRYGGWEGRLIIGDAIRTTLTPLTLDLARLDAIRCDVASEHNKITLLTSRISDPATLSLSRRAIEDEVEIETDGVYLTAGRWQGSLGGDRIKLGANYVSLYRYDSMVGAKENSTRGIIPQTLAPPTSEVNSVVVRFNDDSPDVGQRGAAIYSIQATIKTKEDNKTVVRTDIVPTESKSSGVREMGQYLEISGDEYVEYTFSIPPHTYAIEFVAKVANDYRVSLKQNHTFINSKGKAEERSTDYYVAVRAEGNYTDFSNKKTIRFEYGMATGLAIFGFDFDVSLYGFHLKGEYEKNINYYQYPVDVGERNILTDAAYFVNLTKDFGPLTLGYEYFYLGPKYCTYEPFGMAFYHNINPDPDLKVAGREDIIYPLIDDNDDGDQYPDHYVFERTNIQLERTRPEMGIFPGWDKDNDGVPDNNRNNNSVPDYVEPFLMYYSEPDEFYYGLDLNNNGTIDEWENDELPDFPYYKDERGPHYFATLRPLGGLSLTYGFYGVSQIAGGGINKVRYGRVEYLRYFPKLAQFHIEIDHETKWVKDNIKNDIYKCRLAQEQTSEAGPRVFYINELIEDDLDMKNSLVHTSYIATRFSPVPHLNIINNVKHLINYKRANEFLDGTSQDKDEIELWAVVNKADYTYKYKKLVVMPQVKYTLLKQTKKSYGELMHASVFAPILRLDINLTPRTKIQTGMQGFPFLREKHTDKVNPWKAYSANSWVISVANRSQFLGYELFLNVGYLRTNMDYDDQRMRNLRFSNFFIKLVAGVGTGMK